MAKKGSKFNKYSLKFKEQILKEYFNGEGGWKFLGQSISLN